MPATSETEQAVRDGDLRLALQLLQDQIRARPADSKLRIFLFQLLCVMGQWDRALNQLTVAGELDAESLSMVQTYREAIRCEQLRDEVFLGKRTPLLLGEPSVWVAMLIEAMSLERQNAVGEAQELRRQAFELAPTSSGMLDDRAFGWIADADMRLGPVIEAIINGRYYWVPMSHLAKIEIHPPADLRDCVWMAAHLGFINGGESVALLPTRYSGTNLTQSLLALARKTEWTEAVPGFYTGAGQRLFTTDTGDCGLMNARVIVLDSARV